MQPATQSPPATGHPHHQQQQSSLSNHQNQQQPPNVALSQAASLLFGQGNPFAGLAGLPNGLPNGLLNGLPNGLLTPIAPGLTSLNAACRAIYPNQPNPLQVTAVAKFWMGGPDPLDFISMYDNPGVAEEGIPPHWHYISFGLSDLYGDGRVFDPQVPRADANPSGFGFELTFRLKKEGNEASPPTWPAAVMQSLAKYVFNSENILCPGDHVSWHTPLDSPQSDSRIQHMLMTEDPQLGTVLTPFGSVTFVQIVGVCLEELQASQQWNGPGLIDMMKGIGKENGILGGSWLVTDMRRGESIFDLNPSIKNDVDDAINAEGSNLSGVTAKCSWSEEPPTPTARTSDGDADDEDDEVNANHGTHPKCTKQVRTSPSKQTSVVSTIGHQDTDQDNRSSVAMQSPCQGGGRSRMSSRASGRQSAMSTQDAQSVPHHAEPYADQSHEPAELLQTRFLDSVHITLNLEAGNILPLVFRGRLKHNRHFTFKTVDGSLAITLLTESVSGSHVTLETSYAIHGPWLQVLIPRESVEEIISELSDLFPIEESSLPKTLFWNERKLSVTIVPDDVPSDAATS